MTTATDSRFPWDDECECGKVSFATRRDARKVLRVRFPNSGMQVFRCALHPMNWHFGHPWTRGRGYERQQRWLDLTREEAS